MGIAESNFVPTFSQVIVLLNTVGLLPTVQDRFIVLLRGTYNLKNDDCALMLSRLERSWYSCVRMLMLELNSSVPAKQQHAEWVEAKGQIVEKDFGDDSWWINPLIEATDRALHDHWNRRRIEVAVSVEDIPVWSDPNSITEVDPKDSSECA